MATESEDKSEFLIETTSSERQNKLLIKKIAIILQKIVDALTDTEIEDTTQDSFACKEIPNIGFSDFLSRFQTYGDVTAHQLLAGLIYVDRALRTGLFTKKTTVHK